MANSTLPVTEGAGRLLDTEQATVAGNTVERQRVQIAGADGDGFHTTPAHDSPDTGSPLKIGGKAGSTTPTAVGEGDRVNAWLGRSGEIHTAPHAHIGQVALENNTFSAAGITIFENNVTAGSNQLLIAGAASNYIYVLWMAIGVSANTVVYIEDGSGGSQLFKLRMGANTSIMLCPPAGTFLIRSSLSTGLYVDVTNTADVSVTFSRVMATGLAG